MSAQSTESFRQQTQQTLIQVGALRKRNELLAQGVSPEVLQGEMAKFEIDRQAAVQLQQLNVDQNLSADAIARVTLEAQNAKDAIDQLTAAQMEGTSALDSYVATAMAYVTDTRARITDMLSAVDGALANSIEGVINGTMTIQESFHSFFKSIGQAFLKMAAQIIAKLIIIKLLKTALGLFGSGGGGPNADDIGVGSGLPSAQSAAIAGGGAVEWNSDMPTTGGNILEKFARGGIVTGPTAALIGEGGMNEAVVPLPNGKAIPVDMKGASGGGNVTSNVTVNVSNEGSSSDSDPNGPAKLGKAIDTAVRKVIMDERRSGGLLSQMYTGR
jgi:lambda family phage tail tape measure protein